VTADLFAAGPGWRLLGACHTHSSQACAFDAASDSDMPVDASLGSFAPTWASTQIDILGKLFYVVIRQRVCVQHDCPGLTVLRAVPVGSLVWLSNDQQVVWSK
jgi:hypothetical protein